LNIKETRGVFLLRRKGRGCAYMGGLEYVCGWPLRLCLGLRMALLALDSLPCLAGPLYVNKQVTNLALLLF